MLMMNYLKFYILLVFLFSLGCSQSSGTLNRMTEPKRRVRSAQAYGDWKSRNKEIIQQFVGYTKTQLEKELGIPNHRKQNVLVRGENFEEQWVYRFTRGITLVNQSTWAYDFFFINDKVVDVRVR